MTRQKMWIRVAIVAVGLVPGWTWGQAATPSWPTFRGADRSAVAKDTNLLTEWPENGPPLLWESHGAGRGYASLAIADGRIFTLGDGPSTAEDKDEYLSAFQLATGKPLWKTRTGPAWNSGAPDWQGSRSTPTVDGNLVWVVSPQGQLVCCDATTGAEKWRKDLKTDLEGKKGDGWGYSESVLIDGERVVCTPGGPKNTMVALDKKSGEKIWSTSRENDRGAGHASIVISTIGGTRVYVTTTASGGMGVRAQDGKLLWTYEIDQTIAVIPTPIVRDDLVFLVAGYRRGGALVKQVAGADGAVTIEEIYPLKTELANKHGGVVLVGDYLYGDSDDQGIPYCANLLTGEIAWKERGAGRGSANVIAADGHLVIRYADGTMSLVKASPDKYVPAGSFKIPGERPGPSWAHSVLVDGKLYLREGDRILCYLVSARRS